MYFVLLTFVYFCIFALTSSAFSLWLVFSPLLPLLGGHQLGALPGGFAHRWRQDGGPSAGQPGRARLAAHSGRTRPARRRILSGAQRRHPEHIPNRLRRLPMQFTITQFGTSSVVGNALPCPRTTKLTDMYVFLFLLVESVFELH